MLNKLQVKLIDVDLEEDMIRNLPRERLGCFVQYDNQFVDVLMIKQGAHTIKPDEITVNLADSKETSDPSLVLLVKDIQKDDPYVGSVSIFRSILLEGQIGKKYTMWITLFDDQGDDEYDGQMGINDDEQPRILVELTVIDPNQAPPAQMPKEKPQIAKATEQQQEPSPRKDKKVKSYMNPIRNLKGKGAPSTADPQPKANESTKRPASPSPMKHYSSNKSISKPDPKSAGRNGKVNKPTDLPKSSKKPTKVQDIQQILDQNPTKRQSVAFLKNLLDDQLNKLCSNLKGLQNDNAEIETETIQRLQLIEKFGDDASAGLKVAEQQNQKLKQDLSDQINQHQEVVTE